MSNAEYLEHTTVVESMCPKPPPYDRQVVEQFYRFLHRAYRAVRGRDLAPGAAVLDFGCGIGETVASFLDGGFDAHGVDILEYWGKDQQLHGQVVHPLPESVGARLHVVDPNDSRLPFADRSFDLIVSNQVLEHVFDLEPVFLEQARVLKDGATAIHCMPKRHALIEAHTKLPLARFHTYGSYLACWAALGARNARQRGLSWREAYESNRALFGTTHYVPKRAILQSLENAGMSGFFLDHIAISESRTGRLYRKARAMHLGKVARFLLSHVSMYQVLIAERPRTGS